MSEPKRYRALRKGDACFGIDHLIGRTEDGAFVALDNMVWVDSADYDALAQKLQVAVEALKRVAYACDGDEDYYRPATIAYDALKRMGVA